MLLGRWIFVECALFQYPAVYLFAFYLHLRLCKSRQRCCGEINPNLCDFEINRVGSGILLLCADVQQPVSRGDSLVRSGVEKLPFTTPWGAHERHSAPSRQVALALLVRSRHVQRAAAEWCRSVLELMGRFISSGPSRCRDDHGRQEGGGQTQPAGHRRAAFQNLLVVSHCSLHIVSTFSTLNLRINHQT